MTLPHTKIYTLDRSDFTPLCGNTDDHLRHIERTLDVKIYHHQGTFKIEGSEEACTHTEMVLHTLLEDISKKRTLNKHDVHLAILAIKHEKNIPNVTVHTPKIMIRARTLTQAAYMQAIDHSTIHFGIGPSGTGKTFLAVAKAIEALQDQSVHKIVLARPAVEAGEKLGFLPGDLSQKVDPFLRPIYDAMHAMLRPEDLKHLLERNIIEIAPIAYLRGRTLSESFIILDEAQNTTKAQLKMFITRIGMGSKMVINGDLSQVDLPVHQTSGLAHALKILQPIQAIGVTHFLSKDVIRHPLLEQVIRAYEQDAS
jgi:phosphate starvation-inducible PhoH-like protein